MKQALETYRHLLKQVSECDEQVQKALAAVVIPGAGGAGNSGSSQSQGQRGGSQARKKKRFHRVKTGPSLKLDLTEELKRLCGVDLTQIIGLNVLSVLIISLGDRTGHEPVAQCQSVLFMAGAVPWKQDQWRQGARQPDGPCRQPSGHFAADLSSVHRQDAIRGWGSFIGGCGPA